MSSEWRSPQGEAQLTGSVVYRCHSCGADIDGEVVFADPLAAGTIDVVRDGEVIASGTVQIVDLTPTTRTYHPKHVPVMED